MTSLLKRDLPVRATLAALALALLATAVTGREEAQEPRGAAPGAANVAQGAPAAVDLELEKLERRGAAGKVPDLFALRDPAPRKAIVASPPVPPPAPSAPPLPFTYLGQVLDGGKLSVFLAQGNEHHSVRAGQKIGELYRVERILDDQVVLTYLPLSQRQVLTIPVPN